MALLDDEDEECAINERGILFVQHVPKFVQHDRTYSIHFFFLVYVKFGLTGLNTVHVN